RAACREPGAARPCVRSGRHGNASALSDHLGLCVRPLARPGRGPLARPAPLRSWEIAAHRRTGRPLVLAEALMPGHHPRWDLAGSRLSNPHIHGALLSVLFFGYRFDPVPCWDCWWAARPCDPGPDLAAVAVGEEALRWKSRRSSHRLQGT